MLTKEERDDIKHKAEVDVRLNAGQRGAYLRLLAHIREQDAALATLLAKMRACVAKGTGANVVEIERWIESVPKEPK